MKLYAGGARGTHATPDSTYAEFGGDTTCFLVTGADNYPAHRGWGHSRWLDVLEAAERAGIATPLVIHHDPNCSDAVLAERERELTTACPRARLLRQGEEREV